MNFQPNRANVVFDTIDGEVLAIRSDTGTYYAMAGPAATAWSAVVSGQPMGDIATAVATHHGTDAATVGEALAEFYKLLADESLLIEADGNADDISLPPETAGTTWAAPVFEKYTDMEDLLLFDPIHEVQPSGWPNATSTDA